MSAWDLVEIGGSAALILLGFFGTLILVLGVLYGVGVAFLWVTMKIVDRWF